jgi:hypothetical protein
MVKKEKLTKHEKKTLKKAQKGAAKRKQSNTEVDRSDIKPTSPFSTQRA